MSDTHDTHTPVRVIQPDPTTGKREIAIFDAYAGLRLLGYTRDGALAALQRLGVGATEAGEAARRYHGEGDSRDSLQRDAWVASRCGDSLDYGVNTTRCTREAGHDGAHRDAARSWS